MMVLGCAASIAYSTYHPYGMGDLGQGLGTACKGSAGRARPVTKRIWSTATRLVLMVT